MPIDAVVLSMSEFCVADTDTLPPEIEESAIYAFTLFLITFTIPFTRTEAPTPLIATAPIIPSKSSSAVEATEVDFAFVIFVPKIYAFRSLSNTLTPANPETLAPIPLPDTPKIAEITSTSEPAFTVVAALAIEPPLI